MKTELQNLYESIREEIEKSSRVADFRHIWWDEDGGHDERPEHPESEGISVTLYESCDAKDERENEKVISKIRQAIKRSGLPIYDDLHDEEGPDEWFQGILPIGTREYSWGLTFKD